MEIKAKFHSLGLKMGLPIKNMFPKLAILVRGRFCLPPVLNWVKSVSNVLNLLKELLTSQMSVGRLVCPGNFVSALNI